MMRIGLVSPYSFDVPGGVQLHVRDLAEFFLARGHEVSVLAPADDEAGLPDYVTSVGGAVPVRYNGSVARLAFGPRTASRVGRWLDRGAFDVLHIHEPVSPSVSMLALWAWEGPVVATFHTSNERSRVLQAAQPILRPGLEKIAGRIAVSQEARRTVISHLGGDAVVIPNGVYVDRFVSAARRPEWTGSSGSPTITFLGRVNEPRKGFAVLLDALPTLLAAWPALRVLVAGPGDAHEALRGASPQVREAVQILGLLSEQEKASLLASTDVYVAPNTGGESFGIILIEAMSAGAPVLASDIEAFRKVLEDGRAGALFRADDPGSLARELTELLANNGRRAELARAGREHAQIFDWSKVAHQVMNVYETVIAGHDPQRPPWRLYGRA